jgi:predicted solute-binding protein
MDPLPHGLRIGCVPYLNARPLVWGIEDRVCFEVPSVLSDRFAHGEFDVALLPVYETFRLPAPIAVDGLSISALGAVRSVLIAHQKPLSETSEIVLDHDSRSSSNLLRVLLSGYFRSEARLINSSPDPSAARLMIGDPALRFRRNLSPEWLLTDLSEAWNQWTGLPFVFAVWVIRESVVAPELIASALRGIAVKGIAARPRIAEATDDAMASLDYLTHAIRFGLADDEKKAIASYRDRLISSGLLPATSALPSYV